MAVTLPSASAIENLKKTLEREEQRRIEREQETKAQVIPPAPEPVVEVASVSEPSVEEVLQTQDTTDASKLTTSNKTRRR